MTARAEGADGWFALCGPAGIGLLAPGFTPALAATCWQRLRTACQLTDLLGDLAGANGGRLGTLPPFALAVHGTDGWRIALRAPVTVRADGERLDGGAAATWREYGPLEASRIELSAPGCDAPTMPDGLTSALTLAGGVSWPGSGPAADPLAPDLAAGRSTDATQLPDYTDLREGDAPAGDPAGDLTGDPAGAAGCGPPAGNDVMPSPPAIIGTGPLAGSASGQDPATEPAPVARRSMGRARLSTGEVLELDEAIVIGRRPRASRPSGATLPRLVAVPSPSRDISRSHLEILVDDGQVLVCDLGATNGTLLKRKGRPMRRLQARESVAPRAGDVFHLGDGVSLTFEELR